MHGEYGSGRVPVALAPGRSAGRVQINGDRPARIRTATPSSKVLVFGPGLVSGLDPLLLWQVPDVDLSRKDIIALAGGLVDRIMQPM